MSDHYYINDIFGPTLQGEGARAGSAAIFVRFGLCNLRCAMDAGPRSPGGFDCDTEFESFRRMTLEQIVARVKEIAGGTKWVVLTGGEPGMQLDAQFVKAVKDAGFSLAVETNGAFDMSALGLDWICCSPKVAEHAVKCLKADELKYVRGVGQGIPQPACQAERRYISPASRGDWIDQAAVDWCIQLVMENPDWMMTFQAHKVWKVQ